MKQNSILAKLTNETGTIINFCQIRIYETGVVEVKEKTTPVLITKGDSVIVEGHLEDLVLLSRVNKKYGYDTSINRTFVYFYDWAWHSKGAFVEANIYSTLSKKVTLDRVKKATKAYIDKEQRKYGALSEAFQKHFNNATI